MKKLTVVSLLFLLLVACQNQENTEHAQQSSTSQEKEDIPPEYLDETKYTGDKLEIVKLMNARMRYLYEKDEKRYMNLLIQNLLYRAWEDTKFSRLLP